MTRPSPLVNSESSGPTESHDEVALIPRRFSLPRLPNRSVMNLPNISISQSTRDKSETYQEHSSRNLRGSLGTTYEPSSNSGRNNNLNISVATHNGGHLYSLFEIGAGKTYDSAVAGPGGQEPFGTLHPEELSKILLLEDLLQNGSSARLGDAKPFEDTRISSPAFYGRTSTTADDAVSVHSDRTITAFNLQDDGRPLEPIGKWRCCKCLRGHDIYHFSVGAHPVSILNCVCTHRSCNKCTLDGQIKRFEPMNEPEVIQLSEDEHKQVRFGVFCDGCGLSWRAQQIVEGLSKKSAIQRISKLPKRLTKRGAHPLQKLRHSKSMSNLLSPRPSDPTPSSKSTLNLGALSNEMEKGHGKQAELATVNFTGIQCTCGMATVASSLCFQVLGPPIQEVILANPMTEHNIPILVSTPEDQAEGHGTPVLHLKNGLYTNPLMSNPVTQEDLACRPAV